jgi:hypothetical protein
VAEAERMLKSVGGNTELGGGKGKSCNRFSKPNCEPGLSPAPDLPIVLIARINLSRQCFSFAITLISACAPGTASSVIPRAVHAGQGSERNLSLTDIKSPVVACRPT